MSRWYGMKDSRLRIFGAVLLLFVIVAFSGCITPVGQIRHNPIRYNSPEATQEQFMKDRWECYKETQQRSTSAVANQYYHASSSKGIILNHRIGELVWGLLVVSGKPCC